MFQFTRAVTCINTNSVAIAPMVIAIDGQPCEPFAPIRNVVPAGPGARFELMFDLPAEAGQEANILLRGGGPWSIDRAVGKEI